MRRSIKASNKILCLNYEMHGCGILKIFVYRIQMFNSYSIDYVSSLLNLIIFQYRKRIVKYASDTDIMFEMPLTINDITTLQQLLLNLLTTDETDNDYRCLQMMCFTFTHS